MDAPRKVGTSGAREKREVNFCSAPSISARAVNVVNFARRTRFCSGCSIEFVPIRAHHTRWKKCHAWLRIGAGIAAVRRALEAT